MIDTMGVLVYNVSMDRRNMIKTGLAALLPFNIYGKEIEVKFDIANLKNLLISNEIVVQSDMCDNVDLFADGSPCVANMHTIADLNNPEQEIVTFLQKQKAKTFKFWCEFKMDYIVCPTLNNNEIGAYNTKYEKCNGWDLVDDEYVLINRYRQTHSKNHVRFAYDTNPENLTIESATEQEIYNFCQDKHFVSETDKLLQLINIRESKNKLGRIRYNSYAHEYIDFGGYSGRVKWFKMI